jgi:DNA-binding Lrp family transcriptional regulator
MSPVTLPAPVPSRSKRVRRELPEYKRQRRRAQHIKQVHTVCESSELYAHTRVPEFIVAPKNGLNHRAVILAAVLLSNRVAWQSHDSSLIEETFGMSRTQLLRYARELDEAGIIQRITVENKTKDAYAVRRNPITMLAAMRCRQAEGLPVNEKFMAHLVAMEAAGGEEWEADFWRDPEFPALGEVIPEELIEKYGLVPQRKRTWKVHGVAVPLRVLVEQPPFPSITDDEKRNRCFGKHCCIIRSILRCGALSPAARFFHLMHSFLYEGGRITKGITNTQNLWGWSQQLMAGALQDLRESGLFIGQSLNHPKKLAPLCFARPKHTGGGQFFYLTGRLMDAIWTWCARVRAGLPVIDQAAIIEMWRGLDPSSPRKGAVSWLPLLTNVSRPSELISRFTTSGIHHLTMPSKVPTGENPKSLAEQGTFIIFSGDYIELCLPTDFPAHPCFVTGFLAEGGYSDDWQDGYGDFANIDPGAQPSPVDLDAQAYSGAFARENVLTRHVESVYVQDFEGPADSHPESPSVAADYQEPPEEEPVTDQIITAEMAIAASHVLAQCDVPSLKDLPAQVQRYGLPSVLGRMQYGMHDPAYDVYSALVRVTEGCGDEDDTEAVLIAFSDVVQTWQRQCTQFTLPLLHAHEKQFRWAPPPALHRYRRNPRVRRWFANSGLGQAFVGAFPWALSDWSDGDLEKIYRRFVNGALTFEHVHMLRLLGWGKTRHDRPAYWSTGSLKVIDEELNVWRAINNLYYSPRLQ